MNVHDAFALRYLAQDERSGNALNATPYYSIWRFSVTLNSLSWLSGNRSIPKPFTSTGCVMCFHLVSVQHLLQMLKMLPIMTQHHL